MAPAPVPCQNKKFWAAAVWLITRQLRSLPVSPIILALGVTLTWMGITILSIVVRTLVRRHSSKLKHLPRPKSSNWLYDHAFDIFDEPIAHKVAEWINERSYRQGLMHFFGLFGSEYLIPTNLEELTEVLSQRHYDYEKPGGFIRFTKRFWGHGIVSQEQDEHKVNRKTYLPVFNQSNINKIRSMLTKKSVQLDTLSWALYCLATYPDIQKMFREELAHTKAGRESLEEEEYDRLSMLNRHSHGGHQTISCNSTPPSQSHPRYDHQRSTSSQRHVRRNVYSGNQLFSSSLGPRCREIQFRKVDQPFRCSEP